MKKHTCLMRLNRNLYNYAISFHVMTLILRVTITYRVQLNYFTQTFSYRSGEVFENRIPQILLRHIYCSVVTDTMSARNKLEIY